MATPTYPSWNDKEYDLLKKMTANTALIADYEIGDVASVAGTANQVLVNGGTAAATGNITLSLPSLISGISRISTTGTTTGATDLLINPTTKASGNLIDAQVNGSSKFSVTSAGAGTFGGNLTVSGGTITNSGSTTGIVSGIATNSNASGYSGWGVANTGTSGRWWTLGVGGSTAGNTALRNTLYIYDETASATRWTMDTSGNISQTGNLTVSGGTSTISSSSLALQEISGTSQRIKFTDISPGSNPRNWAIAVSEAAEGDWLLKVSTAAGGDPFTGTTALGFSGNANATFGGNLTVSGTSGITATDLTLGTSGPSVKSTLSARAPRQGLVFDGTTGATVGTFSNWGTADFSVCAWINPSLSANAYILTPTTGSDMYFAVNSNGTLRVSSGGFTQDLTSTGTVTANKWSLVSYVKSGTTATFYINGIASGGGTDSFNWGRVTGVGSSGYVGAVIPLIYNRALSAAEVVALYEAGAPSGADYPATVAGTDVVTNGNFSSATGWAVGSGWAISGGVATTNGTADGGGGTELAQTGKSFKAGQRVRVTFTLGNVSAGGFRIIFYGGSANTLTTIRTASGTYTEEVVLAGSATAYQTIARISGVALNNGATLDDLSIVPLGLLLAPDAAQAGGGLVWYDTSGNAANISWTSGVSWNVPTSSKTATGWTYSGNLTIAGGNNTKIVNTAGNTDATFDLISNAAANYRQIRLGHGATPTYLWKIGYGGATSNDQLNFESGTGAVAQLTQAGALTLSSNITLSTSGSSINTGTSDASDNKYISLSGGGAAANTRGASVYVTGNEFTTGNAKGSLQFEAGYDATMSNTLDGSVLFSTGGTSVVGYFNRLGNLILGPAAADGGQKLQVSGTSSLAGAVTVSPTTAAANYTAVTVTPTLSNTAASFHYGIVSSPIVSGTGITGVAGISTSATVNTGQTSTNVYGYLVNPFGLTGATVTNAYGLFINNVTGATNNFAISTGLGRVSFGDTTASTSTTTGALVVSGGVGVAGAINMGGSLTVATNNSLITLSHQGNALSKSTIESNAGVSGNYNGMRLASNWTGSAQGNNGLSSWFVDFGGYDGVAYGQDKFFIGRAPAGSTTISQLLQISNAGDATFAGTVTTTGGTLSTNQTGNIARLALQRSDTSWIVANETDFRLYAKSGRSTDPSGGTNYFQITNTGATTIGGSLTTSAPTGGAGAWELGVYTATAPTATGYVTIEIGGTQYKLLAATA